MIHVVRQGECLLSLAKRHGFADWRALYEHPENAALRQERSDPTVIFPGDEVSIPEREVKEESAATEKRHRFKRKAPRSKLRIRLADEEGRPMGSTRYTLDLDLERIEGRTDSDGILTQDVPVEIDRGSLIVRLGDEGNEETVTFPIQIGHLDPVEEVSGLQARLNNLGFVSGAVDGVLGRRTQAAITAFQTKHRLELSGTPTAETLAKLKEIHGS